MGKRNNEDFNAKLHEAAKPRAQRILKLREAGETWRSIGTILGITGQRAQAIAAAHSKTEDEQAAA